MNNQPKNYLLTLIIRDNRTNTIRWKINITHEVDKYEVSDNAKYSLFPNPLSVGNTPGEALDNFLLKEEDLIKGL